MGSYKEFARDNNKNIIENEKTDISFPMSGNSGPKLEETGGSELDSNLKKVAKGTGILFFGYIIGSILGLISSMLVARSYSVGEYGLYGLALFIVSFFLGKSTLGIFEGTPRFISYYRGKRDDEKVKGMINSSLIVISISSTLFAFFLFYSSDFIANQIFGIEKLSTIIKIAVIGLPFTAILQLIIAIFRGFESAKENFYFTSVLWSSLKVTFFAFVIYLGLSFDYIMSAYTISAIITCFVAILYLTKKLPTPIKKIKKPQLQIRTLLAFSWPLIFTGLGWFLISGADRLMLGILGTEIQVGLYMAAIPLANYLKFFLSTTIFIFQPIASRLHAENKLGDLKRNYQVLTKWLFILTFPLFIVFLLFPEAVISIIFGEKYLLATRVLQLFTIGWWFQLLLGPNGSTIIAIGKTKMIMFFTLIGGSINIALNYYLIPLFGIEGAALSTVISLALINILNGGYLFKISKIHPFRKNFVIPVISSIIILSASYFSVIYFHLDNFSLLFKIITCLLLILFYFVIILISKSHDKEDLQLLLLVESKIGIEFITLKKIIKKFL